MGHYIGSFCKAVAPVHFEKWWRTQKECYRDGCSSVRTRYSDYSGKNATEARTQAFIKKAQADIKKHDEDSKYYSLDCPRSYTVVAYDVGDAGWRVTKKVRRIVDHKRVEVEEVKDYKKKPAHIPEGARCEKLVQWVFGFDAREYDYYEDEDRDWDY